MSRRSNKDLAATLLDLEAGGSLDVHAVAESRRGRKPLGDASTTGASDMTIPEQLRALASFIEEHGLTDDDVLSAGISYEGGRVLLRIAPFRVLTTGLCVTVRITRSREGHIHHAAETASGGMAITLAACTPSDEVPR